MTNKKDSPPHNSGKYRSKLAEKFKRIVLKSENNKLIEKARADIGLGNPKTLDIRRQILLGGSFVKNKVLLTSVVSTLVHLIGKIGLSSDDMIPLLNYLITNEISESYFMRVSPPVIINSQKMNKLLMDEELNSNKMPKPDNLLANRMTDAVIRSLRQKLYPINISIGPGTTQTELVTYIQKNWQEIRKHEDLYEGKGYIRPIPYRDLYIFIDELRKGKPKLTWKEIFSVVESQPKFKSLVDSNFWTYEDIRRLYSRAINEGWI